MNETPTPSFPHAPPKTLLVGVCGGIAAYKAADVVSRLTQDGHAVHVAMSPGALEFVTPTTFSGVSRRRVLTTLFPPAGETNGEDLFPHLYPASRADAFLLLPATADMMAKIAGGLADDIVCAAVLALPPACLRFFCPAMNTFMWNQPVVQEQVRRLEALGWRRIGPAEGALACGTQGAGRMAEPAEILDAVRGALAAAAALAGRRVLILSGPTQEPIDPVRYIGNSSSGRMGKALAEEALARGATVDFVTGPVDELRLPRGDASRLRLHRVVRAAEMLAAARPLAEAADYLIFAAAVADFAPREPSAAKQPKSEKALRLELQPTPDLAATLCAARRPGQRTLGFALESEESAEKARAKLAAKGLDAIVLNGVPSMGSPTARFQYFSTTGAAEDWGLIDKTVCARRIFDVWATSETAPQRSPR